MMERALDQERKESEMEDFLENQIAGQNYGDCADVDAFNISHSQDFNSDFLKSDVLNPAGLNESVMGQQIAGSLYQGEGGTIRLNKK